MHVSFHDMAAHRLDFNSLLPIIQSPRALLHPRHRQLFSFFPLAVAFMAQAHDPNFDGFEDDDEENEMVDHPIFDEIERGDLEVVQQHVLADAAVLEAREGYRRATPLIHAIEYKKTIPALWLIENWGQHDINAVDGDGGTALHWASAHGMLELVQALIAAGVNPAALCGRRVEEDLHDGLLAGEGSVGEGGETMLVDVIQAGFDGG